MVQLGVLSCPTGGLIPVGEVVIDEGVLDTRGDGGDGVDVGSGGEGS